ncbi:MAG: tryptophan--tRNA ligase [Planctomycetes bacterium]|nr:tryptophan--tRNA ligase [Planctomycetota bacterium]
MKTGTILSGMRPTGRLHIGHLVGALSNWAALQDEYTCFFMIADWHALMSEYANPEVVKEATPQVAIDFIAAGLDPERSTIFVQSDIAEHLELYMAFSCVTPLGWLERCPTYKEQMRNIKDRDISNYAFLGYPVLQAADILIYKADTVPVGEDQLPHVELTREVARRFNNFYGEIFPEPQGKLTKVPRLPGLDGRKMSKSYGNFISLSDTADDVSRKVMTMFTDPQRQRRGDPGRPDVCNLYSYYEVFAPDEAAAVAQKCRGAEWGCTDCKKRLAEVLSDTLAPIQKRRAELEADPGRIERILSEGAAHAREIAQATMAQVREAIGLKMERR